MVITQNRFVAAVLLASLGLASAASAQETERLPRLGFSIAERAAGNTISGPLFQRTQAAFAAARQSDAAYVPFLTTNAEAQLSSFSGEVRQRTPFTAETIRAASESCLGPFAHDEGTDWVQLSWVCRVDGVGPLAQLLTFRDSPELSLTVWFEGNLIKRLDATEPLMIPGARRVGMGAYAAMQANR